MNIPGVAVRNSFLASLEHEINNVFNFLTVFIYNFRLLAAILTNWLVVNLFCTYDLTALPYLGQVTEAFPLTPSGYEIAEERMPVTTSSQWRVPDCIRIMYVVCGVTEVIGVRT